MMPLRLRGQQRYHLSSPLRPVKTRGVLDIELVHPEIGLFEELRAAPVSQVDVPGEADIGVRHGLTRRYPERAAHVARDVAFAVPIMRGARRGEAL